MPAVSAPTQTLSPAAWRRLPKAELHVHLEGTIDLGTLQTLLTEDPPILAPGEFIDTHRPELRESLLAQLAEVRAGRDPRRVTDFPSFLDAYRFGLFSLRSPADWARVLELHLARLEAQGVVYAEILHSPLILPPPRDSAREGEAVLEALLEVLAQWRDRVRAALIIDMTRNLPATVDAQLAVALAGAGRGVVGIGLGGLEEGFPATDHRERFDRARAAGLRVTCHAGETAGPLSVRQALAAGAERIGHGVRSVEDPALLAELAARGIPLEVCPTSNVIIGVYPSLAEHPLPRLLAAGVEVSLNSDDPGIFGSSLTDEYRAVREAFGFDALDELRLVEAGFRHAFLPAADREAYLGQLQAVFAEVMAA